MAILAESWDYELRNRLLAKRIQLGISQHGLARMMRTSQSRVSQLENGSGVLRLSLLAAWSAALKVRLEIDFYDGTITVRAYDTA